MKQVLIETLPFQVSRKQLHEGVKAPSGNPLVEGILATAEVKNGNVVITQKSYGKEKSINTNKLLKKIEQLVN